MKINIKTESLQKEIIKFQEIVQRYQENPEYINPNVSQELAKSILSKLVKEFYLGYRID